MTLHRTSAIVLRRQDYRESSLLVTLFTQDLGKIRGVAKGIRGLRSRFASRLEPWTENLVVLYEPVRGELFTVAQAELQDGCLALRADLAKGAYATYLSELVDATQAPEDRHASVYGLLREMLRRLGGEESPELLRRTFEVQLLGLSGLLPRLDACVQCSGASAGGWLFSVRLGGVLCRGCAASDPRGVPVSRGAVTTLRRLAASGAALGQRVQCLPAVSREIGVMLDQALGLSLGRPPRSLAFLELVR